MILLKLVFLYILLFSGVCQSQNIDTLWTFTGKPEWTESFAWDVMQVSDSGYVLVGCSECLQPSASGIILKLTSEGREKWSSVVPNAFLRGVAQLPNGDIIACGNTGSLANDPRPYCSRTSVDGEIVWSWEGNSGSSASFTSLCVSGESIYCAGYVRAEKNAKDIYIAKLSFSGDTLWTRSFGSALHEACYAIHADSLNGGAVLAGSKSLESGNDAYAISIDSNGSERWSKSYGTVVESETANSLLPSEKGWLVLGGSGLNNRDSNIFLLKIGPQGDSLSMIQYGDQEGEDWRAVNLTSLGKQGFLAAASIPAHGRADIHLLQFDQLLLIRRIIQIHRNRANDAAALALTSDGGCVVAGTIATDAGGTTLYVVKTGPIAP